MHVRVEPRLQHPGSHPVARQLAMDMPMPDPEGHCCNPVGILAAEPTGVQRCCVSTEELA